ncbi:transmembrane protein 234 homolog [Aplysia californica]|uniref:Transmembrane protein 234 homolog n=1 Tax=Aplysia californica TaxID=6500 RepID=A0ABM0JRL7_APLCA|nr:transmembrane protein 234 homolog [Aplysia californica]
MMSGLASAAWLTTVAFLWGATNPLLKRNSKGVEKIQKNGKISQFIAEFKFLFLNWKYLLSFLLNQSGSVVYYITLASADLTLAVPITNSLTFIFTALSSQVLGEKNLNWETLCGMVLVVAGVLLCVLSKTELEEQTSHTAEL